MPSILSRFKRSSQHPVSLSSFFSFHSLLRAGLGTAAVLLLSIHHYLAPADSLIRRLELLAYDMRLRATMPSTPDPRIVIVDIDEKSLIAEGRWPWGRDKVALLVRQLFERYQVKVAGIDVVFAEADNSSGLSTLEALGKTTFKTNADYQRQLEDFRTTLDYDRLLADEIKKYPVVLSFMGSNTMNNAQGLMQGKLPEPHLTGSDFDFGHLPGPTITGYNGNLPLLHDAAAAVGHIVPQIDVDGVLRRVPLFIQFQNGYYESFSSAIYRTALGNKPLATAIPQLAADGSLVIDRATIDHTRIPLDHDLATTIPFRGKTPMFPYISATDVMQGTASAADLTGKIVLVGTSAQGLLDLRNTPVDEIYPGVEAHASMLSGLLDNNLQQPVTDVASVNMLLTLLIGLPLTLFLTRLSPLACTLVAAGVTSLVILVNFWLWHRGYIFPIAGLLILVGVLYLLNMSYGFFVEARQKRQIADRFGHYVPKEIVAEIANHPDDASMRGETREMTVLFADIRNFTTISEGFSATELTAMMNTYLTAMTEAIQTERGTIDKYIGDAIMAFWGAPLHDAQHAAHALQAALAMQKRLREIGPSFTQRGWPQLQIGIGLNNGPMNVGDMGSRFRRAYTVMGDAVNLASRLEGLTKEYGVGIVVSAQLVQAAPGVLYRELDRVRVKGRLEPVSIHEPIGPLDEVTSDTKTLVAYFHTMLHLYRQQQWDAAETTLTRLTQADHAHPLYALYQQRIHHLRQFPPAAAWDGVYSFTNK